MKRFQIQKRSGAYREIYAPNGTEKRQCRIAMVALAPAVQELAVDAHGFRWGRSAVTNARVHVGHSFSLTTDLQSFFDHVTLDKVQRIVPVAETRYQTLRYDGSPIGAVNALFPDGAARQGLPSSPTFANLAAVAVDRGVREALAEIGLDETEYSYSRYADDLTVSYDRPSKHAEVQQAVEWAVMRAGFALNPKKTRLQWARAGRRVICGVAIDSDGSLHPKRKLRRRLRAALHQNPTSGQSRGLSEWAKLRAPKSGPDTVVAKCRVRCTHQLHRLSLLQSGEIVAHNHTPTEIRAGIVAGRLGGPICRCAQIIQVYQEDHPWNRRVLPGILKVHWDRKYDDALSKLNAAEPPDCSLLGGIQ